MKCQVSGEEYKMASMSSLLWMMVSSFPGWLCVRFCNLAILRGICGAYSARGNMSSSGVVVARIASR